MKISSLLTSAGINIGLCVLFLSLYSVLRKQPANVRVYFGRRIAEEHDRLRGAFILERFVPSTGWIVKALRCTEEEILAAAGLDAVVFNRILVFRYTNVHSFWAQCALCTEICSVTHSFNLYVYLFIFNSIRIFSLAALLGLFGVLPLNYFGQDIKHVQIPSESLDIFTIGNVAAESRW
jgi:calcium permeable stress-gated cation channel